MEQLNMEKVYKEMGCKTDYDKLVCNELTYLVYSKLSIKIGCDNQKTLSEIRKWLYKDKLGTPEEKVLGEASYWGTDLAKIFGESVGIDEDIFSKLTEILKGKEVISGVVLS